MNSIIDPEELRNDLDSLEKLEKATLRLVCESILKIAPIAQEQFEPETRGMADSATGIQTWSNPSDRYSDLGEDLTRMALDNLGFSRVPDSRLFGAIDYKAARYVFLPEFAVEQALFVDSKAEKNAYATCRVQITQTSLAVRQSIHNENREEQGLIDKVWESHGHRFISTTLFVKYHYEENPARLKRITIAALPNGFLQDRYNPTAGDSIWRVGPNAETRGEKFRTRLSFPELERKARWRVQRIFPDSIEDWQFQE